MQKIFKTVLLLAILQYLPSALGAACTRSNALQYSQKTGCSAADIARDDTGCVKQYCRNGGTSQSLQTCFCIALGESNCGKPHGRRDEMESPKEKRQGFSCSSGETCYINPVDQGLFCLNTSTGAYVGETGDSGNVNTGAYTAANGATSAASVAASTGGISGSTSKAVSSVSTTTSGADASATSSSATAGTSGDSATISSTIAETTSSSATVGSTSTKTAGVTRVTAGVALGFLGLAVGIAL